jgi:membrane protease subunit (stomatin/prohibitin family)
MGIRYSALPGHTLEISEAMDDALTRKWSGDRGIHIVSVSVNSVTISPEDEATIKELQKTAVFRNTNMAAAHMVGAQAEAMKSAAANPNGAMMGFMGMGMAQAAGGMNAAQLFQMSQQQQAAQQAAPAANGWKCSCGATATGKFCPECGAPKPAGVSQCKCDNCGWEPEKGAEPPKFCPECGYPFDDGDIQ